MSGAAAARGAGAPLVSVIVPTFDEQAQLPALLDHLEALPGAWEVILADGGSRDRTAGIAAQRGVRLVASGRARAGQLNAAAATAAGELLVFLHADSRLPRDAHASMTAAAAGEKRTLHIIIKADQGGPAEALADALGQLSHDEVSVDVIHRGVGSITESDILLARSSGAVIVGFHVRPDNNARAAAEREGVEIKLYKVIYEAVEDIRAALEGMLRPEERELILGEAEVRETFKVPRLGLIAGCSVRSGTIQRGGRARVIRDGSEIYDGVVGSLRRFKDDVKEVREGFECGIGIENFNDIKLGDVIECYRKEQVARTLASSASA